LYEAFYCVLLFLLLFHLWYWHRHKLSEGFAFGVFLTLLWSLRFLDEFVKLNQEPWEEGLPLNMGQMLSIPMIIIGLAVIIKVGVKKKVSV
jgi:prolipoprotein diacylglyceryltransferase